MKNRTISLLPLLLTNFFTVMDDNILKTMISLISAYWIAHIAPSTVVMMAAAAMVIPFIFFSPLAGFVAKKVHHQKAVIKLKILEIILMSIAALGFAFKSLVLVLLAMFLMGLQSTFFAPLKFSMVRDIGGIENSATGVGVLEMTTFFGVLAGTFVAGLLADIQHQPMLWITFTFACISLLGLLHALLIKAPENKPMNVRIIPWNFLSYLIRKYRWALAYKSELNHIIISLSIFWMIASLVQMNLMIHCPQVLQMSGTETGITLAVVAICIGLGSFVAGKIAGSRILLMLTPLGGSFFIVGLLYIAFAKPDPLRFQVSMALVSFAGGFLKNPLSTWMQVHIRGRLLGEAIAYMNLMNFIFILLSALIFGVVEPATNTYIVFLLVALLALFMITHVILVFNKNILKRQ